MLHVYKLHIEEMKKKLFFTALFLSIMLIINGQHDKVSGSLAFTINEKDLIPEGITYDPVTHQFFVSSINKEKVVAINEAGTVRDFLRTRQDGILQTLGMKVDVKNRRLWVVSNTDSRNSHQSAVHVFNIEEATLIKKFILATDTAHLFNDIALSGTGDAYITDSYSHTIYTIPANLNGLRPLAESGSFLNGSNGLAVSSDNTLLYVATADGITIINLKTLKINPIRTAKNISAAGIDGLVFYGRSLIGVTNSKNDESEMFIAAYQLCQTLDEITEMSILDKGNPVFNLPTTCVVADDYLYCLANTSLRTFFNDRTNSKNKLQNPVILKYKLTK